MRKRNHVEWLPGFYLDNWVDTGAKVNSRREEEMRVLSLVDLRSLWDIRVKVAEHLSPGLRRKIWV